MKVLSLEVLLKRLVTAQHEVDEITEEIKRRADGRKKRPVRGSYIKAVPDKDEKASS